MMSWDDNSVAMLAAMALSVEFALGCLLYLDEGHRFWL